MSFSFSADKTLGAGFIGFSVSCVVFGVHSLQAFSYWVRYPLDRGVYKGLVRPYFGQVRRELICVSMFRSLGFGTRALDFWLTVRILTRLQAARGDPPMFRRTRNIPLYHLVRPDPFFRVPLISPNSSQKLHVPHIAPL